MQIPFFTELNKGKRFLIVGAGGGYDITHGIPLYLYLTKSLGKQAVLANFSFTMLARSGAKKVFDGVYQVTSSSNDLSYFPEKNICQWFSESEQQEIAIYALDYELGVQPLRSAYNYLIDEYKIDTILLVDGGTDSIIFGDEKGLGTIVEDANSMVAAIGTDVPNKYIAAIGFGVDHFHGVNHYNFLENVATIIQHNGYLGAFSLTKEMPEGSKYLALVDYLNQCTDRPSIVANSITDAIRGLFGDVQHNDRTAGSKLFINPLMPFYWTFKLQSVVDQMEFAPALENTFSINDVINCIQKHKIYRNGKYRYSQSIPL